MKADDSNVPFTLWDLNKPYHDWLIEWNDKAMSAIAMNDEIDMELFNRNILCLVLTV